MKINVERGACLKALNHVQSVVVRRNTSPILTNVLIEAGKAGQIRSQMIIYGRIHPLVSLPTDPVCARVVNETDLDKLNPEWSADPHAIVAAVAMNRLTAVRHNRVLCQQCVCCGRLHKDRSPVYYQLRVVIWCWFLCGRTMSATRVGVGFAMSITRPASASAFAPARNPGLETFAEKSRPHKLPHRIPKNNGFR